MSDEPSASATAWVVLGTGGHARSVVDVIARRGDLLLAMAGSTTADWGVPVCASDDEAFATARRSGAAVVLAIGEGRARVKALERARAADVDLSPLIARSATVSASARLEPGCQVLEHAHVGPGALVGAGSLVNTGAVVEHDAEVGEGTHVAPGAVVLGAAVLGDLVLLGAGASVLPQVRVGDRAVVGAGAVVREDVGAGVTVVGIPASPHHA